METLEGLGETTLVVGRGRRGGEEVIHQGVKKNKLIFLQAFRPLKKIGESMFYFRRTQEGPRGSRFRALKNRPYSCRPFKQ